MHPAVRLADPLYPSSDISTLTRVINNVSIGPFIPFDLNGIWPLAVNPKVTDYPLGSRARMLAEDFSSLYLQTLTHLQTAFDGSPQELPTAVANMFLLRIKAREMVKVEFKPGIHAGPTFENPLRLGRGRGA